MRRLLFLLVFAVVFLSSFSRADVPAQPPGAPSTMTSWLYDATSKWLPSYAIFQTKDSPVAESLKDHDARRRRIVSDVWTVVSDPKTPMLFGGPRARERTALLVLGVWKEESNFDIRVDKHHCKGMPKTYCDSGAAWCMGQIHPADVPQLGYSGAELQADNMKCALATIHRLAAARAIAPKNAPHVGDMFCGYAVGHYVTPCPLMRLRYSHGATWLAAHPPPAL